MPHDLNHLSYFPETHAASEYHIRVAPDSKICVRHVKAVDAAETTPVVLYMPGYRDDMTNPKRIVAEQAALASDAAFVTLDYRGHGRSRGSVRNESLTTYMADAEAAVREFASYAQSILLVGHSIGANNALHLAAKLEGETPGRVAGVIAIAPVPALMAKGRLGHRIYKMRGGRDELKERGHMTNTYARELVYCRAFLREFQSLNLLRPRNQRVLQAMQFPVRVIVSDKDAFSPMNDIEQVASAFRRSSIIVCPKAKHTMAEPDSLAAIATAVREMAVCSAPFPG